MSPASCALLFFCFGLVSSHMTLVHPSVWNFNDTQKGSNDSYPYTNNWPLGSIPFTRWWFHGLKQLAPPAGTVLGLPANGKIWVEISTNKKDTSYGTGMLQPVTPVPWVQWALLHTDNRTDVMGCAMAISYQNDVNKVGLKDYVVFSVARDCIARQNQSFAIPNLPPCPNGKCLCKWLWQAKGFSNMWVTDFACNVVNPSSTATAVDVANAQPARKCFNPSRCTQGPRYPMWYLAEGANMPETPHVPPTYSVRYGWSDGAQHDIFVNTNPNSKTAVPVPTELKCTNATINPNGLGSRITSNGPGIPSNNRTFSSGIFSPNCLHKLYVDGDTITLVNRSGNVVTYVQSKMLPSAGPYTLKISNTGVIQLINSTGIAVTTVDGVMGYGTAPFRLDINDDGLLSITDALGIHRWENLIKNIREDNVVSTDPDPVVWKTYTSNTGVKGDQTATTSDTGVQTATTSDTGVKGDQTVTITPSNTGDNDLAPNTGDAGTLALLSAVLLLSVLIV